MYGTPEYELLRAKNAEVDAYNAQHREAGLGRKGRKQRYTAQRLFKQEELEKRGGKGGIDGFRYQREILIPILYPFYEAIQAANPDVTVWLIEDNAPAHTRAARQCEENRRLRNIQKCEWPK